MKTMLALGLSALALAMPIEAALIGPFGGGGPKPVVFDPAAPPPLKADQLKLLSGTRTVIIPEFTVEFVTHSEGLAAKQKGQIRVNYDVTLPGDDELQALVDGLYQHWVAGLHAHGLTVQGPKDAAQTMAWTAKLAKSAKAAPAYVSTAMGTNRIFTAEGGGWYFLAGDRSVVSEESKGKSGGGMFSGMGGGFGAIGIGQGEMQMAKDSGAAVMTVHIVLGLHETETHSPVFAMFKTAQGSIGDPKFSIQAMTTEVAITPPSQRGRATLAVPADFMFQEELLAGHLKANESAGSTASNIASRGLFALQAVGGAFGGFGGGAKLQQSYRIAATPELPAYMAAARRNLEGVQDALLRQLQPAWQ